jgi:hypothetical protein
MSRPKLTSLTYQLSDWEVVEAYCDHKGGTPMATIAARYGVCKKTFERAFRKLEKMMKSGGTE